MTQADWHCTCFITELPTKHPKLRTSTLPRIQPSCAVSHPSRDSGWRVTQHGAILEEGSSLSPGKGLHHPRSSRDPLNSAFLRSPLATSGAPHSSFGTYRRLVLGDRAAFCSSQVRRVLPLGRERGQAAHCAHPLARHHGVTRGTAPFRYSSGSHVPLHGWKLAKFWPSRCAPLGWDAATVSP